MTHLKTNKTDYKKFLIKLLSATLVVLMLIPLFVACSDKPNNNNGGDDTNGTNNNNTVTDEYLIRECVETFLTAYNEGDMDAVLECLDAKSRNAMEAMLNLLGGVAGSYAGFDIDLKDLFSIGISTVDDDFMLLDIISVEMRGNSEAVVTTSMSLPGGMNEEKAYFIMVYEKGRWCISDITSNSQNDNNTSTDDNISQNIDVYGFKTLGDGIATIDFNIDDHSYKGVANACGEIFHYGSGGHYESVGNGAVYLRNSGLYKIINSNGETVASSETGAFDKIIGCGDGLVLVYKNTSNISKIEHSYGVINSANGEWIKPLTAEKELPINDYYEYSYYHIGNGLWAYDEGTFYNSNTGNIFELSNGCTLVNQKLQNEKLYVYSNGWNYSDHGYICYELGSENWIELPLYSAISVDGSYEEMNESDFYKKCGNINVVTDGEYLKVYGIGTGIAVEYTEFSTSQINEDCLTWENYVLLTIQGADDNDYFTVIDGNGIQQFAPIKYNGWDISFSDGKIVCNIAGDYEDGCYVVFDVFGEEIISANDDYDYIGAFANGVAIARTGDWRDDSYHWHLIDTNGNVIDFKLK